MEDNVDSICCGWWMSIEFGTKVLLKQNIIAQKSFVPFKKVCAKVTIFRVLACEDHFNKSWIKTLSSRAINLHLIGKWVLIYLIQPYGRILFCTYSLPHINYLWEKRYTSYIWFSYFYVIKQLMLNLYPLKFSLMRVW